MKRLVLASGSPRRREILDRLGYRFEVRAANIDESPRSGEKPDSYVRRLAEEKALAAARPTEIVLAADTIVVLDGELLGKPADEEQAAAMLGRLSGRSHEVLTGIAVLDVDVDRRCVEVESTSVRFATLEPAEIRDYIATGEPMDKAGAYAIQGLAGRFVESIDGSFTNVVGLPVARVRAMLGRAEPG